MPSVETEFAPWAALIGGGLIGVSSVLLMLFLGRIAGIVGVTARAMAALSIPAEDRNWRFAFLGGLLAAAPAVWLATGEAVRQSVSDNLPIMALAGLLVGFGSALGSGCTSGHGVCGLARLSPRSLVAVVTFMGAAVATVFVVRHVIV